MGFTWGGVSTGTLGVVVTRMPNLAIPQRRSQNYVLPGRSGSLNRLDGAYNEMIWTADCYLPYEQGGTVATLEEIRAWLGSGYQYLILDTCPGVMFRAWILDGVEFMPLIEGFADLRFTVSWRVEPYRYLMDAEDIVLTVAGEVNNPGNAEALPRIKIVGSGDIELTVNDAVVSFDAIDATKGDLTIDSDYQEAWQGTETLLTGQMSGSFPVFKPGTNTISWTGSVTSITISPNWRSILYENIGDISMCCDRYVLWLIDSRSVL